MEIKDETSSIAEREFRFSFHDFTASVKDEKRSRKWSITSGGQ